MLQWSRYFAVGSVLVVLEDSVTILIAFEDASIPLHIGHEQVTEHNLFPGKGHLTFA